MAERRQWLKIGKLVVNPDDVLAVKVAQAGQAAAEKGREDRLHKYFRPTDQVEVARLKRERKAQKRLENIK